MRHNLPPTPAFRDSPATDGAQEIALRVIVEFPGWQIYQLGTAVLIGGHLAITARHVLEEPIRRYGAIQATKGLEVSGYSIQLLQVLPGPIYRMWNVARAWITSTDIAILHIGLDRTSENKPDVAWRSPILRLMPPPSGEKVLAFGYRESKIEVSQKADGSHHIELNDKPTTSIGEVGQISESHVSGAASLPRGRPSSPFPARRAEDGEKARLSDLEQARVEEKARDWRFKASGWLLTISTFLLLFGVSLSLRAMWILRQP